MSEESTKLGLTLSDMTLHELSEMDDAIARRQSALMLERRMVERWFQSRIDCIKSSKGRELNLPEAADILQDEDVEEAIERVRSQIGAAADSWVLDLLEEDLDNVERDLINARALARKCDPDNRHWTEFEMLKKSIDYRRKIISSRERPDLYDIHHLPSAPSTAPKVPAYPSKGFQYKGIGADSALEICWNTIQGEQMQETARLMDSFVVSSQRVPILWALQCAEALKNE